MPESDFRIGDATRASERPGPARGDVALNEQAPRVSVLMTVRNGEAYLAEAIQSIQDQTFEDFELVIYDDGSTDDSARIAGEFAAADPRIAVRHRRQAGAASWLREGVETSFSEFVALMSADDVADPERLETQVAHLRAHPECVGVGAQVLLVDAARRPIAELRAPRSHAQIDEELLRGSQSALPHSVAMLRRADVLSAGNYRDAYPWAEQLDLLLRLAERGRLANLSRRLLEHRQHVESVCGAEQSERREHVHRVLEDARRRRGLAGESAAALSDENATLTRAELWACWARAAIGGGHPATARHYARRALFAKPWSWSTWRLALRAHLGASRAIGARAEADDAAVQASLPQSALSGRG